MKKIISIIVTAVAAIGLGIISADVLFIATGVVEADITIKELFIGDYTKSFAIQAAVMFMVWFFSLISLPFFITDIVKKFGINSDNWKKTILVFELFSVLISFLVTPPDMFSTYLLIVFCQFPILVNALVIRRNVKKEAQKINN